jgi:hypothetical protein
MEAFTAACGSEVTTIGALKGQASMKQILGSLKKRITRAIRSWGCIFGGFCFFTFAKESIEPHDIR